MKLTHKIKKRDVARIRDLYASGAMGQKELAKQFRISQSVVSLTVRGILHPDAGGKLTRRKLERVDREEILRMHAAGMKPCEIIRRLRCHPNTVYLLLRVPKGRLIGRSGDALASLRRAIGRMTAGELAQLGLRRI